MTRMLWLACCLTLLAPQALGGAPSIFCEKPIYNLGDRSQLEKLREPFIDVPFIIENRGDADLIITEIRLSCGCTKYRWDERANTAQEAPSETMKASERKTIAPGNKEKLTIAIDTAKLLAPTIHDFHDYRVRIHSNDPEKPLYVLKLRGSFVQDFSAPRQLSLGNIHLGRGKRLTFPIRRLKGAKSDIVDVRSTAPFISAIITRKPTGRASIYTILVAVFKNAPAGIIDHRLVFRTKGAKQKSFVVPLTGKIIAEVDVSVERIVFGPVSRKTQPSRDVFITQGFNSDGKDLRILGAKIDSNYFSIASEVVKKGAKYRLRIKLRPDAPVGTLSAKLVIRTNKDAFKVIEVPIYALVRE